MKSNSEMMRGQSRCHHCSRKPVQLIKRAAKKSYRRRFKETLNNLDEPDTPVIDPTSYGFID